METTQTEAKAQDFIDALHALEQGGNDAADQIVTLFAADATLRNSALDIKGQEAKGSDEILQFWVEYKETLGQVESKFHHITLSANAAGLFWTTTGQRPNGEAINYHGATLLQFNSSGLIEFFRGYYDTHQLTVKADV